MNVEDFKNFVGSRDGSGFIRCDGYSYEGYYYFEEDKGWRLNHKWSFRKMILVFLLIRYDNYHISYKSPTKHMLCTCKEVRVHFTKILN